MPRKPRADLTATPHDAIIKFTFSQQKHAAGLLRAALAPEVTARIQWSTLRTEKIHFVDRTLRGRYADLLFSAMMDGERVYIYLLVEHQSDVETLMIFRMGSYMWRHWEALVRDDPKRTSLPLTIPILIHHSPTGWTAATAFKDIIAVPEGVRPHVARFIPDFEMRLVDVSHDPSGGLVEQALTNLGRIVLFCLSVAGDDARLEAEIGRFVAELNALYATPREIDALIALLRYLVATHRKLSAAKIAELLKTTAEKGEEEMNVDVLDELKREGRVEGKAEMLLDQIAARFGAVPAATKAQVRAATDATLKRWSLRVLTAPTIEAVLGAAPAAKKPGKKPAAKTRAAS